jgi:hypothetical protein
MQSYNATARKPSYLGHVLIANRNGLIVDAVLTQAEGNAERDAALLIRPEVAAKPSLGQVQDHELRE